MSKNKTTESTNDRRPPVSYLVSLNDKLQRNADNVERNINEIHQYLKKDVRNINEGRQYMYQEHIDKTILNSLEQLSSLDEDVAEASRLQHPQSEMIEKDMKQLRERVMKLREEHDHIYNCSPTITQGKTIHMKPDDSDWEIKRPSEDTTDANIKYSVSSSEGQHECSETGLRWSSGTDVSLTYNFADWDSVSKDHLQNYRPCGPLIDLAVTSGTLQDIQLPHYLCLDSETPSDDAVKVLYVKDGTVLVERCELKGLHAKLVNPTAALLGVVTNPSDLPMKCYCETLIYRNRKAPLNLHVYLIAKDQKLKKYVEEKEKENMEIVKPNPDEGLTMDDSYVLKTSCASKIKPSSLKLTPDKTNFFDLHIQEVKECVELSLEIKDGKQIWDINIEADEFNTNDSAAVWRLKTINRSVMIMQWWRQLITAIELSKPTPLKVPLPRPKSIKFADIDIRQKKGNCKKGAEFVDKHRAELIRRVSLVEPIADDMKPVIGDEKYQVVLNSGTNHDKMRKLLEFLTTPKLKDKLYQSLLKHEDQVVEHLESSG